MNENFEDKFMDLQSGLISLCLEITNRKVDKIYAYASIEEKSAMFNAFFEVDGEVITINQLCIDKKTVMQFLKIGTNDLSAIKNLCEKHNMKVPTELKMYYDVKQGKYNADYQYTEVCSAKTGINAGEVFMNWMNEVKSVIDR